ncbi:RagB/SusD family nutrient uptake outer membrane protein [Sphingobacterium corticibacterium]|uniref:RagB/SusD family nutrient uptake outer membrane protein n=2 Tax=Sphingobacterium corticibacterium TaxID=2484746 RepID=A0A4V2DBN3_9SPHI|nr:RagB/SusD family nutrient uptake outer membrane protein [Sphingobacterium corticibacterium]
MPMKMIFNYINVFLLSGSLAACSSILDVVPNSEFSPDNVLKTEEGIKSLLFSAYAEQQTQQNARFVINDSEVSTDMAFNSAGAENGQLIHLINFTWTPTLSTFQGDMWGPNYRSIRDANGVIENIADANTSEETKNLLLAEAKVLRAHAYANLYNFFGPVPLRLSTEQVGDLERATDEEMKNFIESQLIEAIPSLPDPGDEESFGRFNKGNATGILAKFYLNTKQWQKAADAAKAVIDFDYYSTTQYNFKDLFKVENEGKTNREMLLVLPCRNEAGYGNWFMAGALPPNFKSTPEIPEYVYQPTMSIFATQYRLRTAFVNSMSPNDLRRSLICTSYINNSNVTVNILEADNARSFKYWDNAIIGNNGGADVPVLRYADILLTRAEALNELSGPTDESFTLINQIRKRAGLPALSSADAGTKEQFREALFKERGWEFISEGKRREDLIRQGTFLSSAIERGISSSVATADKLVFPIPQSEIDANKLCEQNPGY